MRRIAALGIGVALAASSLLIPSGPSVADVSTTTAAAAKPGEVPTRFAFQARGLGTKVVGGDVPAGSAATATKTIGCTNMAGRVGENFIADVEVPGLGHVSAVRTRVWTAKHRGVVSSNAKQTIGGITLLDAGILELGVTALESRSRVWHDKEGYHSKASAKVLGLSLTLPGQDPVELDLPTPGNPIEIPGLLKISLGTPKKKVNNRSAFTAINALDIQVTATGTRVKAGYSRARIAEGVVSGIFKGYSAGLSADVLEPIVELGKTPLHVMPCEGTEGEVTKKTTVGVDVPGVLDVGAVEVRHAASQRKGLAKGFEAAEIADVSLLDGVVQIEAIEARATVRREGSKLIRRPKTSVATITIQGQEFPIPIEDPIEVPGVVKIEPGFVKKVPGGLHVVALRITALDGSVATIDLGIARLRIQKSA